MRLSVLLLAARAAAQQLPPLPLWPAGAPPPGENGFVCGPEALITTHGPYADSRRYYNVSRPTLTPFIVRNGTGAVVIIAPGGGYQHLAIDDEGYRVAALLNAGGVSALVLKYRVPQRPAPAGAAFAAAELMDAQRALGVARLHAGEWGVNVSRVGFLGFSAGGHLSAHVAAAWRARTYPRVDAADDFSARPDFSLLMYPWMLLEKNNASSTTLAPELLPVDAELPPAFIANNLDDTTAWPENALVYQRARVLAGAPAGALHLYPRGGHGFGVCAELDPVGGFEMCCDWVNHALRFMQFIGAAPGWPANLTARAYA